MIKFKFPGLDVENEYMWYPSDALIVLGSALLLAGLRMFLSKYVFHKIALYFKLYPNKDPERYRKFRENAWYFIWYTIISISTIIAIYKEGWGDIIYDWEIAWRDSPYKKEMYYVRYIYLLQLGYNIQMLLLFLWVDIKLEDYNAYVVHHVSSIVLIAFSYVFLYAKAGILVMVSHDIVDVFLYGAKMFHNLGSNLADIFFVVFAIAMFAIRLIYYPLATVFPCFREVLKMHNKGNLFSTSQTYFFDFTRRMMCFGGKCVYSLLVLNIFAFLLYTLQLYWFVFVVRMCYRVISGDYKKIKKQGDIRKLKK